MLTPPDASSGAGLRDDGAVRTTMGTSGTGSASRCGTDAGRGRRSAGARPARTRAPRPGSTSSSYRRRHRDPADFVDVDRQPVVRARRRGVRRRARRAGRRGPSSDGPDVAGVPTTAVTLDGTTDLYAQDTRGNVWWFGHEGAGRGVARPAPTAPRRAWSMAADAAPRRRLPPGRGARCATCAPRCSRSTGRHRGRRRTSPTASSRGRPTPEASVSSSSRPTRAWSCWRVRWRASRGRGRASDPVGGADLGLLAAARAGPAALLRAACCWAGIHCWAWGSHCQPSWMIGCSAGPGRSGRRRARRRTCGGGLLVAAGAGRSRRAGVLPPGWFHCCW